MGFRTTFVSGDEYFAFPDWFIENWKDSVNFCVTEKGVHCPPISSKRECKTYSSTGWDVMCREIARVLDDLYEGYRFDLLYFHECGGVEKVEITCNTITKLLPTGWQIVNDISREHGYDCLNCWSDCDSSKRLIQVYRSEKDMAVHELERFKLEHTASSEILITNQHLKEQLAKRDAVISELNQQLYDLEQLVLKDVDSTINKLEKTLGGVHG